MLSYFNVQCVKTGIEQGSDAGYLAEAQVSWTNRIIFFFSVRWIFKKKKSSWPFGDVIHVLHFDHCDLCVLLGVFSVLFFHSVVSVGKRAEFGLQQEPSSFIK